MQAMRPRETDDSAVDRWRSGRDRDRQHDPLRVRLDRGGSRRHGLETHDHAPQNLRSRSPSNRRRPLDNHGSLHPLAPLANGTDALGDPLGNARGPIRPLDGAASRASCRLRAASRRATQCVLVSPSGWRTRCGLSFAGAIASAQAARRGRHWARSWRDRPGPASIRWSRAIVKMLAAPEARCLSAHEPRRCIRRSIPRAGWSS